MFDHRKYSQKLISDALSKYGGFFAFSNKQFDEAKKEGVKYVNLGAGLLAPKENADALVKAIKNASSRTIKKDIKENGLAHIIERELVNYEAYYTGDIEGTVDALASYGIDSVAIMGVYNQTKAQYNYA